MFESQKSTFFLLLTCAFAFSSCIKHKIVYINPDALTRKYHGAIIKHQDLLYQAKTWQANLDSLNTEMAVLPPLQAKAKAQQFQQYRQAIQQKARAQEALVNQEILAEINASIKQYGMQKGYDFILGATENGNIVYAAEGKDVTEEVLAGLNKQYDEQHKPRK